MIREAFAAASLTLATLLPSNALALDNREYLVRPGELETLAGRHYMVQSLKEQKLPYGNKESDSKWYEKMQFAGNDHLTAYFSGGAGYLGSVGSTGNYSSGGSSSSSYSRESLSTGEYKE
jgi:hypothetical protein